MRTYLTALRSFRLWLQVFALWLFAWPVWAISLDGGTAKQADTPGSSFTTGSLTTTSGNDIIMVCEENTVTGSPAATVTGVTGASLTFVNRSSVQITQPNAIAGTRFIDNECWWALASTVLTSQTFSINFTKALTSVVTLVFAVHGANTASPFDPNVSIPSYSSNTNGAGSATNVQTTISTTTSNTFIFGFGANYTNPIFQGAASSPWAQFCTPAPPTCAFATATEFNSGGAEYQVFTSPQSGLVVGAWSAGGTVGAWTFMADAIVGGPSAAAARPQVWINE